MEHRDDSCRSPILFRNLVCAPGALPLDAPHENIVVQDLRERENTAVQPEPPRQPVYE